MASVEMTSSGMACRYQGSTILLDPKRATGDVNFVSHAHTDHLPGRSGGVILASKNTTVLASVRGHDLGTPTQYVEGLRTYDSGHILGSQGLLMDDVFYTGDICTRARGFLRGARIPRCRTLVTECTFGLPKFRFPPIEEIRSKVDEMISMFYARGVPVVLMGYELGKAQTLSQLFSHWEPMYYYDSIKRINEIHKAAGVAIKPAVGHTEAKNTGLLDRKPWVMIAPPLAVRSPFRMDMKRYGAVTILFSGWAAAENSGHLYGADYAMPLSDHCDFGELVEMVVGSGAEQVYTVHGYVHEFAEHLHSLGITARPLEAGQAA